MPRSNDGFGYIGEGDNIFTNRKYMSGVFFIAPYDPKDWEQQATGEVPKIFAVNVQKFGTALKKRWLQAEIRDAPPDSPVMIYWGLMLDQASQRLDLEEIGLTEQTIEIETERLSR